MPSTNAERRKKYYYKHQSRCLEFQRLWRENNWLKNILRRAELRAKQRNIEFNLLIEDLNVPDVCPVLGIKLDKAQGKGIKDSSPSLDRIDNSKGYTKDNVLIVSYRANRIKSNASADELMKIALFYSKGGET
jgi:hypothetical protein